MCLMDGEPASRSLRAVSFSPNDSWAARSWDSAYSFRQERARFQQKQLQEKEERLVRLYEEHRERALRSVGSRSSQSGGRWSASVGVGKVRHMFQTRRGHSESRLGAAITGRDKSYPLEPLPDRERAFATSRAAASRAPRRRSVSSDSNDPEFPRGKNDLDWDENGNGTPVRRAEGPRSSGRGRSFRLVDEAPGHALEERQLDEPTRTRHNRWRSDRDDQDLPARKSLQRPPRKDPDMEGRYRSYVSQSTFARKPHLGNGTLTTAAAAPARTGVTARQVTEVKETSSGYLNGTASSPVRKIRKPTPVPLSVAPAQHLLQKEARKTPRVDTIKEVPSPSARGSASRTFSTPGSLQKPPTPGRSLPSSRVSPAKAAPAAAPPARSAPPPGLVDCRICGRHFAGDRVAKHEEVCQKSSRNKRKPFDALQQRVKGTEVEQFIKKSTKSVRSQPEKAAKPQSNWRKKHEEFINNIRAAKEVSAHLKKGGKLSDLPPPPPSDYSDYVPCPHCGRKFSSSAAERHIPKCAHIINNKPRPGLQKTAGPKQGPKLLHAASPSVRGRK